VREFEALETAKGLQEFINDSSEIERKDLKEFEVSIEDVENARNIKSDEKETSVLKNGCINGSSTISNVSQYRYQIEDVPWDTMAEMGLDREKLEEIGALDALLKGYKTPMLIPDTF